MGLLANTFIDESTLRIESLFSVIPPHCSFLFLYHLRVVCMQWYYVVEWWILFAFLCMHWNVDSVINSLNACNNMLIQ